jgi:hypothetical protein
LGIPKEEQHNYVIPVDLAVKSDLSDDESVSLTPIT